MMTTKSFFYFFTHKGEEISFIPLRVSSAPVTTKQELVDNILSSSSMTVTGTAESLTKLIYAINAQGELLYTDLQGNPNIYSDDYNVIDTVIPLGG